MESPLGEAASSRRNIRTSTEQGIPRSLRYIQLKGNELPFGDESPSQANENSWESRKNWKSQEKNLSR
jgi:hypothetical protein